MHEGPAEHLRNVIQAFAITPGSGTNATCFTGVERDAIVERLHVALDQVERLSKAYGDLDARIREAEDRSDYIGQVMADRREHEARLAEFHPLHDLYREAHRPMAGQPIETAPLDYAVPDEREAL